MKKENDKQEKNVKSDLEKSEIKNIKKNLNKNEKIENVDKNIIEDLKIKLKECEDRVLRCLADNENLRKRHERELEDSMKYANKNFSLSLLSIADNFQRAMDSIPKDLESENELFKNLYNGVKAIEKEFYDVFEKNGIKKFSSKGQKFNPELHQAVNQVNHNEIEEGFVVDELQVGFNIGERLLRPSMVSVSKGLEKKLESQKDNKINVNKNDGEKNDSEGNK